MTQHPDVDVVIATRDRPQLLRDSIRSIVASDYAGAIRVLVVYDRSEPDNELHLDASLGLRPGRTLEVLHNNRTPGLAGARNSGVLAAEAELVAFCDDDDTWLPAKLTRQIAALNAAPTAEMVCCGVEVEYAGTFHRRLLDQREVTLTDLLRDRLTELHPSTFVMRRKAVIDGFGLVEEEIPGSYAEDYEFLLRAARSHPVLNVPMVGVRVLWSQGSYFTGRWTTIREALTWLLDRYPEFASVPEGEARILGQIAFATASEGSRRQGAELAWRALRTRPAEPRTYLALGVASGILKPDWVIRQLHRTGRGL
ncbi:MAG TPA: glycosyltransferase family 2 protein [Actinomycetes bacterium]|nr:glycosyltransferase family 2 protein [Actinomycetes bacterium]